MVFSDTTNKAVLIQRYERYTELGDGVVSGDTDLLKQATVDINETIYDLTNQIILMDDNFEWDDPYKSDYPIATTPLVAGQRDYQFDSISFLKLKRVDVSWDGSRWYRATPFDSGAYSEGMGNDDAVDNNFYRDNPQYDPKAFGFWLYPRATADDVANGGKIRIEYQRAYTEFSHTDTSSQPPIDRPFHDLIAVGSALRYPGLADRQYNKLTNMYQAGLSDLTRHYGTRNEDFTLTFNPQIEDYT